MANEPMSPSPDSGTERARTGRGTGPRQLLTTLRNEDNTVVRRL